MLLHKQVGMRSEWEYPFAVAGVNISFMLVQMLDLQSGNKHTGVTYYSENLNIQYSLLSNQHHVVPMWQYGHKTRIKFRIQVSQRCG